MHLDRDVRIDAVEAEIRLIERMPLSELRALWVSRWGFAPRFGRSIYCAGFVSPPLIFT